MRGMVVTPLRTMAIIVVGYKENVITASTKAELTGNDFGDYFIEKESYSGAICREVLEVRIKNQVKLYGEADIETPWHINSFDANSTSNPKGWLSITGLKGTDKIELKDSFFKLGAFAPDNSTIAFGKQTPVGRYPVTETGITEANLPVLKNYIVSVYDGQLEIEPREVVVTASDGDWYVEDEGVPEVHATFSHPWNCCAKQPLDKRRRQYPTRILSNRRLGCMFSFAWPHKSCHPAASCQPWTYYVFPMDRGRRQHLTRAVSNRRYAGKNGNRGAGSFIPVRLVTGGVMPVIFL